ncbi:VCBS repeat-containing protein [Kitasatospora purpeofusca]|uniref:VCBS repeat-containing protein n=1 Tax=Kitasatospora purpeofusca TaxID=67352 RepID=A0ABZ1TXW7_9ACTN|nr:VCBS repeat-containing protein [Kitasatospora purpeofusca]
MSAQRAALRTTSVLASIALTVLALGTVPAAHAQPEPTSPFGTVVESAGGGGQGVSAAMTAAAPQLTRSQVVARAASWYNIGLDYDWDSTYQGYRKDCSGYVSMAWQLATPGLDTTSFEPNGAVSRIAKADLKAGDALLNNAAGRAGHIVLFERWTDASQTSYIGYEFTGGTNQGVKHRTIPYPYFSGYGTYFPVRAKNVVDDAVPQPPKLRLDFNGDGRADVAGKLSDGNLLLWTGRGNGTLDTASGYSMWPGNGFGQVSDMVAADFNGDGRTDVAGKLSDGNLLLWTGNGNGTLDTASGFSMWPDNGFKDVHGLVAGDFNGDGKADIAGKLSDGNLLLWTGLGNGTLNTASGYSMWPGNGFGQVNGLVAGDFNGDGKADIAGKLSDGNLLLWTGLGNGTLDTRSGYSMWPDNGFKDVDNLVADDFNGDGKADIAGRASGGALLLWTGNGAGTLNTDSGHGMWPDDGFKAVNPLIG